MADPIPHVVAARGDSAAAPKGSIPVALYGAGAAVTQAPAQEDSTATDVAGIVADHNALLAKLRTAGVIAS